MWPGGCGAEAGISSSVAWSDDRKNPVIHGKILEMCEIFCPKWLWCALAIKQQSQQEAGWTYSDLSDVFAKQAVMSGTWLSRARSRNGPSVRCPIWQHIPTFIQCWECRADFVLRHPLFHAHFSDILTQNILDLVCRKSGAPSPPRTLVVPFLRTPAPRVMLSAAFCGTSVSFKNINSDFQRNPEVLQVRRCDKNRVFYLLVRIAHRLIMSPT